MQLNRWLLWQTILRTTTILLKKNVLFEGESGWENEGEVLAALGWGDRAGQGGEVRNHWLEGVPLCQPMCHCTGLKIFCEELKSYSFLRRISKIFASIVIDIIDLEFSQTNLFKSIARGQVAFSPKRNRLKTIIMIWILSRTMISRAGGRCQGSLAPFWCFRNFLEISVGLFLIRGSPEHSKKLSFSSWLALKWLLPPFQHLGFRIQHLFRQYVMWWRRRNYKYLFPLQGNLVKTLEVEISPWRIAARLSTAVAAQYPPWFSIKINMISSYHYTRSHFFRFGAKLPIYFYSRVAGINTK